MQLETYVAQVRDQLVAAAALGDDRAREIAATLAIAAGPAVQLALFAAVAEVADEITAALLDHPGSPAVAIRIDGDRVAVDLRTAAAAEDLTPSRDAEEASARISLRLSDSLKADIDAAAEGDRVSVNTWLVRAAAAALRQGRFDSGAAGRGRRRAHNDQHVTGWING